MYFFSIYTSPIRSLCTLCSFKSDAIDKCI